MAHNIDTSTGQAAIAFRGSRQDIWHRMGQQAQPGWTIPQWATAARLDWTAERALAYAGDTNAEQFGGTQRVDGYRFLRRSDTKHILGIVSDRYQPVQPADVLQWFSTYIAADPRFQLDVAGSLKQGEIIWATAVFQPDTVQNVAGDAHQARLLMTTTFDGTGSTINRATMTRVVCNNTLDAALADRQKSIVRTRHSTKFDGAKVNAELAAIAGGFEAYRAMGDAMAAVTFPTAMVSRLFKAVLEIPFDAPSADVSQRKQNQFAELSAAFSISRRERNESEGAASAWTALQAVTRWVDHSKSTRNTGGDADAARFTSANFGGTGARLKATGFDMLVKLAREAAIDNSSAAGSRIFNEWLASTRAKVDA